MQVYQMVFTTKKPFFRCWNQAFIPISTFVTSFKYMATCIYITVHPTLDEDILQKINEEEYTAIEKGRGSKIQKRDMTNKKLQRKPFLYHTAKGQHSIDS